MKWGEFIKRTAVRRVVWILVGVLVYAALGAFSDARAQDFSNCDTTTQQNGYCPDRGTAYSMSRGLAENLCANYNNATYECLGVSRSNHFQGGSSQRRWWGYQSYFEFRNKNTGNVSEQSSSARFYASGCPAGQEWHDGLNKCATPCSARESMPGTHRWTSADSIYSPPCVDGCVFEEQGAGLCAGTNCVGSGGLAPTGAQCTAGPTPSPLSSTPDGVCNPIGNNGAQHCVSSGQPSKHCIVHASGLSQCWDGTETGPRVDRTGTQGASREVQPATPAPHPEQQGAKPEGSDTARAGGGNFNIIEFSGTGNSADASDNGSGPGQGSAPGWGNTIGQGPGNKPGDGSGDGDGDGPGKPGPGLDDDFYQGDERTIGQLYDEFQDRVSDAAIVQGIDNFFTAPAGGACPVFTMPAVWVIPEIVFDFHCREPWSTLLSMMGWVVLAFATYLAFRIAIG